MTLTAWILWGFLCGLVTGAVVSSPMGFRGGYHAGRQDALTYHIEWLRADATTGAQEQPETLH